MAESLPDASLDQLFRTARTARYYLDRPVGEDTLRAIWELLKMGPTSANQQPVRLVWCASQEARDKLAGIAFESNQDRIRKAPMAVVVGMDLEFHQHLPWLYPIADMKSYFAGSEELRRENAMRNSSLQGAYLILAARALGLDCGPMSGFDNAAADKAFFADQPSVRSNFIATLGYGDRSKLHDRLPRPDFEQFNRIA